MENDVKTNKDLLDDLYNSIIGENDTSGNVEDNKDIENNNNAGTEGETEDKNVEDKVDESSSANSEDSDSSDQDKDLVEDESIFDDWDSTSSSSSDEDASESEPKELDYSEIGKALGMEKVTKDELLDAIKKVKQSADTLGKLPEDLGAAVKLALEGKDYKSIFKSDEKAFDHSLYDDETLLKHEYSGLFKDGEGNIDMEELNMYIESLDPIQKKIEAKKIRQALDTISDQRAKQAEYEKQQEYLRREQELRQTLDSRNDIKGFKLTPDSKKGIYDKIASGEAVKDMFYNDKGQYDMAKVVEAYFIYQNFDKIKGFLISKARNETKREDFNNISNASVNKTSSHADASPEAKPTGVDLLLKDLMERNGLT